MQWHVLTHLNPAQAEVMLHRVNESAFQPLGKEVEYFIPYQFLTKLPTGRWNAETENEIRSVLHRYVFVYASEEQVNSIVESELNCTGRLRFNYCRTKSGVPLTIADAEMRQFIETLRSRQLKYYIGQPLGLLAAGDHVTLHLPLWEGRRGTVTRTEVRNGQVTLTVSLDILGNLTIVSFTDLHKGDVSFDDEVESRLMHGDMLRNFEEETVALLGRNFGRRQPEEVRRRDLGTLSRLYAYADTQFERAEEQQRFTALMLLCATMRGDKDARDKHVAQLRQWLGNNREAETATEAYLMIALYAGTRESVLREAVKRYKNAHPDCPEVIKMMFGKVKRLSGRK